MDTQVVTVTDDSFATLVLERELADYISGS